MKRKVLKCSLFLACLGFSACFVPDPRAGDLRTNGEADLLPSNYVAPPANRVLRDITYNPASGQKLDIYLPTGTDYPVILWVHPGGWVSGAKSPVHELVLRQVSRGYAVVSIDYRLSAYGRYDVPVNPFPAAVHDVKTAVRWVKANAGTYGFRADSVIIAGGSAGGHLASFVAATPGKFEPSYPTSLRGVDSTVAAVVDLVGPSDLNAFSQASTLGAAFANTFLGCPRATASKPSTCSEAKLSEASPASHLTASAPPGFFAYGGLDTLVPATSQGAALALAWGHAKGDKNKAWYDYVNEGGHNLDPSTMNMRYFELFLDMVTVGMLR